MLPGLVISVFLLVTRKWELLFNRTMVYGIAAFTCIAFPWYVVMAVRHEDYLQAFLLRGNMGRFFSADAPHKEAFYYYVVVLAVG